MRGGWRRAWVQVHLWLGLTLGTIGVLIGVSGTILIYQNDIDHALNPQRYAVSGNELGLSPAEYIDRAAKALNAQMRPTGLRLPQAPGRPVTVLARSREAAGGFARVYLDPPTGNVLEVSPAGGFIVAVRLLHEHLMLRDHDGRTIVGAVGFGMLVSSLTGLCLWWPGRTRARRALGFRHGLSVTRNLHYFFGLYGAVVLAMLSFTGIFLAFPEGARNAVSAVAPVSPSMRAMATNAEERGERISVDDAVRVARDHYPDTRIVAVELPGGPRGVYRIGLDDARETASMAGNTLVFVDAAGTVVRRVDASTRTGGDSFLAAQRAWHAGVPFGPLGRALIALVGILPALFVVTGATMWLRRR